MEKEKTKIQSCKPSRTNLYSPYLSLNLEDQFFAGENLLYHDLNISFYLFSCFFPTDRFV